MLEGTHPHFTVASFVTKIRVFSVNVTKSHLDPVHPDMAGMYTTTVVELGDPTQLSSTSSAYTK
jgi:hypothetical protein